VVLRHREPDDPAGRYIEHAVEIYPALLGADLGAVAIPLSLIVAAAKSRPTRSGARHPPRPGRGGWCRRRFGRARRPSSAMIWATVFTLTRQPSPRSSAVIRGDP
jgi:hypothetical protein